MAAPGRRPSSRALCRRLRRCRCRASQSQRLGRLGRRPAPGANGKHAGQQQRGGSGRRLHSITSSALSSSDAFAKQMLSPELDILMHPGHASMHGFHRSTRRAPSHRSQETCRRVRPDADCRVGRRRCANRWRGATRRRSPAPATENLPRRRRARRVDLDDSASLLDLMGG